MMKNLSPEAKEELLKSIQTSFENNKNRHEGVDWAAVESKLEADPQKLWSLNEMARTGGEPDVVGYDQAAGEFIFSDCAPESPEGRRSLCYDDEALEARKKKQAGGQRLSDGTSYGSFAVNGGGLSPYSDSWRVRHDHIELAGNTFNGQGIGRRDIWRSAL